MRLFTTLGVGFTAVAVLAFAVSRGGAEEKATYVGDSKCMKCHSKQVLSWKKTGLAKTMEALKPVPAENKDLIGRMKKAGLDPAKDYSADPACLKCHTTGYGKDGGYPEKVTEENAKVAKAMGSVSCESCHGPASLYLEYKNKKRAVDKEATFTREELLKLGLVVPTEETCKTCHNDSAPIKPAEVFKF